MGFRVLLDTCALYGSLLSDVILRERCLAQRDEY